MNEAEYNKDAEQNRNIDMSELNELLGIWTPFWHKFYNKQFFGKQLQKTNNLSPDSSSSISRSFCGWAHCILILLQEKRQEF